MFLWEINGSVLAIIAHLFGVETFALDQGTENASNVHREESMTMKSHHWLLLPLYKYHHWLNYLDFSPMPLMNALKLTVGTCECDGVLSLNWCIGCEWSSKQQWIWIVGEATGSELNCLILWGWIVPCLDVTTIIRHSYTAYNKYVGIHGTEWVPNWWHGTPQVPEW